jgi:hypothetical protein
MKNARRSFLKPAATVVVLHAGLGRQGFGKTGAALVSQCYSRDRTVAGRSVGRHFAAGCSPAHLAMSIANGKV